MLNIKYDILSLNINISIIIINIDSIPPLKLRKPATAPLVIKINIAFNTTILIADEAPMKNRVYITTIFANPNFIPGTGIGIDGNEFSINDIISANANSIAVRTNFLVLLISFDLF